MSGVVMPVKERRELFSSVAGAPPAHAAGEPGWPAGGPPPVFDRSGLLELFAEEDGLLERLIERYLGFLGNYLDLLSEALFAADLLQVQLLAHDIKGAALNVGAMEVNDGARRLELLAASGELRGAVEIYAQLVTSVETFRKVALPR
jgi:HPt (histidine-containing phosphotransfer) domain-containing protein